MVQLRDKSDDSTSTEMIISFAELLGMMNLMGVDTTGVTLISLKKIKGNGAEIELPTGEMISGESLSFKFSGLTQATDTTELTITGITFG